MATTDQSSSTPQQPIDPAQLGADQSPETSRRDDNRDMSSVLAEADKDQSPDTTSHSSGRALGSEFSQQRQQSAAGHGAGDVGRGQGMGRSADNGDEDRGYDQSSYRGGLGSSGGVDDHADRQVDTDTNPYTGGYDGGNNDQPPAEQTKNLGLNTPSPTGEPQDSK